MATPFDQDGRLNIKGAVALAQKLVQEGTTALVLAGTTGESPTLTDEEKLELFVSVKKAVPVPVIANVGTNNTEKSAALAEKARKAGMDGVMAVVPYYNKPNRAGLVAHFEAIVQAAQLPVMVYNVPGRTGSNMDADTILRVADIPGIAALKEATGEFDKISYVLREAPQSFSVYTGEDALTLPVLAIGAYGVVSVAAHVAGKQMRAMIDHYIAGRVEEARKLHLALTPIYKSLFVTTNPIPLKAALKLTGFDAGPLRLPLVEADEAVVALLRKDLEELGKTEGTV
jgi:4-hydroxy-tetrahydrodipicolinate synthase